ncbi:uncharacterized protein LOC141618758 isoform X2 [Silene latifolia]|uniref:uncharacterized protein LOC141618758 isoform X2 n=1 Tax=Silene latifolia TaxID=37657 RepID=UPI003D77D55E
MATLPFRPPQFSDDVAWLPPWLQPNHSQSSMTPFLHDDDNFPHSQNVDIPKGDNNHAKDLNLLLSGGSVQKPYNVCRLYLSGEDSSPITLTPCEKVLHFNLYLSTDGTSSINDTSQNDFIKSADDKALHPTEVLHSPRKNSPCNMDNDNSVIKLSPPPEKNRSGKVCKKTSCKSRNSKPDNSEIYNAKGAECDDVIDAVELSVAASEALVIHEMIQTEPILEAMSSAATLEVALRVKQARVDGVQDYLYCLKDTENISETLSDLSDSDLEDAYNDVGFLVSRLDNISSMDPSVSRVKDTPMTHIYPDGEREVQSEWNQDMEYFKDSFLARPMENNLGTDKSKDLLNVTFNMEQHEKSSRNANFDSIPETPCHPGLETLDNIQVNQGENNRIEDDHLPHQNLTTSLQLLHSGKTDMNKEDGGSSCRYQSRWVGGWGAKDEDCRGAKESNYAKPIRKMLINEASYLSESTYVAPDQNSVVNYHQSCSKSSEASKQLKDSCKIAIREALVSQDVVKDSNSSITDSLCSMVPCSISSEIGKSSLGNKKIDNSKVITAIKSSNIGTKILSENVQTSSGQNDEEIERKESTKLILGGVGVNPINRRQKRSLKDYSRGSPGNSPASVVKKKSNMGLRKKIMRCCFMVWPTTPLIPNIY